MMKLSPHRVVVSGDITWMDMTYREYLVKMDKYSSEDESETQMKVIEKESMHEEKIPESEQNSEAMLEKMQNHTEDVSSTK